MLLKVCESFVPNQMLCQAEPLHAVKPCDCSIVKITPAGQFAAPSGGKLKVCAQKLLARPDELEVALIVIEVISPRDRSLIEDPFDDEMRQFAIRVFRFSFKFQRASLRIECSCFDRSRTESTRIDYSD